MDNKPEFAELVERHGKEILFFLYRMLPETPDAEDCLQETFLRAYQAYDRLDGLANLRAWLYRIAHNVAATWLKQRAHQPQPLSSRTVSSAMSVEAQIAQRLQLERLRAAVEALPYKQRTALILRRYQGLSYREVGEALQISTEAARANVYQGLKQLRAQFAEDLAVEAGGEMRDTAAQAKVAASRDEARR